MELLFKSTMMTAHLVGGTTIRYSYNDPVPKVYELRDIRAEHLTTLRTALTGEKWSRSASVQLLTHWYIRSHFYGSSGELAPPVDESEESLLPKTPFSARARPR